MPSPAERIIELYQRYAADWDRQRGCVLLEKAWLDRFLALLPPNPSVLDIGCGSAEPVDHYLIENGCHVTGIDSSPGLIDICRRRFPEQEWLVADMRELALERSFDGILAWDSFFHLCPADQPPMFPIFRRHGAPNAALLLTSGHRRGEIIASWKGEPLYHGSLAEAEYRSLLAENDFEVVSYVVEDPHCGEHTVWLAKRG
jgi:SAM-dependent methyltransferase